MSAFVAPAAPVAVESAAAPAAETSFDSLAAYNRLLPLIAKVPEETFVAINRDVVAVAAVVLRALPKMATYRPALEATFKTFDLAAFDRLTDLANATRHANGALETSLDDNDPLPGVSARAAEMRELLVGDVGTLIRRRRLGASALVGLRGPSGYANVAYDLLRLAGSYRDNWAAVSPATAVSAEEVEEARLLADRMTFLLAQREQADKDKLERAQRRKQVFTLLATTYEDARQAIGYVLYTQGGGDIEAIAPSFYTLKRTKTEDEPTPPVGPSPSAGGGAGNPSDGPAPFDARSAGTPQAEPVGGPTTSTIGPPDMRGPLG